MGVHDRSRWKGKLYDHTNRELVFFKDRIESAAPEIEAARGEFVAESVYQPNRVHRHLTPADEVTFHTVTPSMGGQFRNHVTVGQGMNEPSPFDAIREFEFDGILPDGQPHSPRRGGSL